MLVVDIGNSRVKWCTVSAGALGPQKAMDYEDETLARILDREWSDLEAPDSIAYCSVGASATDEVLERWAQERWGVAAGRVRPAAEGFGVRCAYARPETLGADRWAALIACRHKHRRAAIIVDCGTAITLDAIADDGRHLGGAIVPGVSLMRETLTTRTDQIPEKRSESRDVLAASTADGVAAGTLYAAAAAVDRLVAEAEARLPAHRVRVLTGGAMDLLQPIMTTEFKADPALVLYGLAVIGGGLR